ncbi:MAG TPA: photosystem II reaction center protein PsbN [Nostocaceae cyanobacterium]|nr:photosystem II reaction center protein PsbN [Nostocaceae cyanobacterium]
MDLDPGVALGVSLSAVLIAVTAMAIYTSFGPPSKELSDPFEDHED